jgi:hypothetical protein
MPPLPEGLSARERWAHWRERYARLPRAQREGLILGLALIVGLVVMPFLIWLAGSHALGPYTHAQNTHAGPFALLADYWVGLLHGSAVFWVVAVGPALLLLLLRLLIALLRALPGARAAHEGEDD